MKLKLSFTWARDAWGCHYLNANGERSSIEVWAPGSQFWLTVTNPLTRIPGKYAVTRDNGTNWTILEQCDTLGQAQLCATKHYTEDLTKWAEEHYGSGNTAG